MSTITPEFLNPLIEQSAHKTANDGMESAVPIDCSCGGSPIGKGALLVCGNKKCIRTVQMPSRALAIFHWNKAISQADN